MITEGSYVYEYGTTGWTCVGRIIDGVDGPYILWYE